MTEETIKNLEEIIQKYTGPSKKLVKSTVKRFTAPGDNYLGIVLKVDAVLKNEKGEEETFSAIAKCLNFKTPEFIRKTVPIQYKKENAFYTVIVPTLEEFQKEVGLEEKGITDMFPKLYASRCNLDDNGEPDADAVLLFENLGDKGYANADRTIGFDLTGAKLVLEDLAAFHAIPLALKLKKPDVFNDKIEKHLYKIFGGSKFDKPPQPPPGKPKMEDIWLKLLEPFDEVKPYFEKIRELLSNGHERFMSNANKKPKGVFATISHSDLWTNNTMQIFKDGEPIKNKIIDFQIYNHNSSMVDVLFFLWSSVQMPVILEHFESLLKFYHNIFINILDKCGCDTIPYSYEKFLEEVEENAKHEFFHIFFMLIPIYGKKGEAAFDPEGEGPPELKEEKISETARKRAASLISEFGKRNWL